MFEEFLNDEDLDKLSIGELVSLESEISNIKWRYDAYAERVKEVKDNKKLKLSLTQEDIQSIHTIMENMLEQINKLKVK